MRSVTMLFLAFLLFLGLFVFFLRWTALQEIPVVGPPPPMPQQVSVPEPPVRVEEVAGGLEEVRALEAVPGGRLFVGEADGRIRVLEDPGGEEPVASTWTTLEDVAPVRDGGLMDLAHAPGDETGAAGLYALHTALEEESGVGGAVTLETRVVRIPLEGDGAAGEPVPVLEGLPAGERKNGGRMGFGPQGMLHLSIGDVGDPPRAQDADDAAGAILRVTADGGVPPGNPRAGEAGTEEGERVWAFGFRDVRGLAWHPRTGTLFAADRGPGGEWAGIEHLDEINVVRPGRNYGWPEAVGAADLDGLEDPLLAWVPAHRPGDLAFTPEGDLLMTAVEPGALVRVELREDDDGYGADAVQRWFIDEEGRSRFQRPTALAVGADGAVYFSAGESGDGATRDRVLRLESDDTL